VNEQRIGIIGCGAVTAKYHLPALQQVAGIQIVALADPRLERTRELAATFAVPHAVADYRDLLDRTDAVILALPHHLHATIGVEALKAGKHVLMEKPLANTVAECDALIAASRQADRVLAVGQVRRYTIAIQATRQWLTSGLLGDLEEFHVEEGGIYGWPVASDFFFKRETSGGGVLMDTGAHVLDTLRWWLGDLHVTGYEDDDAGGIEADCTMRMETNDGIAGTMVLSRLRTLSNRCLLRGSRALLEVNPLANWARLVPHGTGMGLCGGYAVNGAEVRNRELVDLFRQQAEEWLKAIRGEKAGIATAEEARATIRMIQEGYARRIRQTSCWERRLVEAVA
jgi:predicted dehydrogenase